MRFQQTMPETERFWSKVDKSGGEDACWLWTGSLFEKGYGQFTTCKSGSRGKKKVVRAHRYSYELAYGPLPEGQGALHKCDCRKCVNPRHLFAGDQYANMKDANAKGRVVIRWTPDDVVLQIKILLAQGMKQRDIARQFGITQSAVSLINLGKSHREVQHTYAQLTQNKSASHPAKNELTLS